MDDTQKTPQTVPPTADPQQVNQPVAATPVSEVQPVEKTIPEPEEPVSGPGKELGITGGTDVKEYVMPSQPEIKLAQEIKEAGVIPSPNTDQPNIQSTPKKAPQITLAKESVPVQTKPQGIIQFPMEEEKATQIVKTTKPRESIRWLATLIIEQVKKAHKLLKS